MKFFIASILLVTSSIFAQQQDQTSVSVENSVFGIQTGFFGIWVNNEARLTNNIALRSEIGFDAAVFGGSLYGETKFALVPVIAVEPRYYYNFARRVRKDKNISNNSGNFLTVKLLYEPDWFLISNDDNIRALSQFAIIPKYGLRRVYGKHFSFELGLGVGVVTYSGKNSKYYNTDAETFVDLHLRVGYNF